VHFDDVWDCIREHDELSIIFAHELAKHPPTRQPTNNTLKEITSRLLKRLNIDYENVNLPDELVTFIKNLRNPEDDFKIAHDKIKKYTGKTGGEEEWGATREEIRAMEHKFDVPYTLDLVLFYKYFNNCEDVSSWLGLASLSHLAEMYEPHFTLFWSLCWITVNDDTDGMKGDFCVTALDPNSGVVITVDLEYNYEIVRGPGIVEQLKKYVEELEEAYIQNNYQPVQSGWKPNFEYERKFLRHAFPLTYDQYCRADSE